MHTIPVFKIISCVYSTAALLCIHVWTQLPSEDRLAADMASNERQRPISLVSILYLYRVSC